MATTEESADKSSRSSQIINSAFEFLSAETDSEKIEGKERDTVSDRAESSPQEKNHSESFDKSTGLLDTGQDGRHEEQPEGYNNNRGIIHMLSSSEEDFMDAREHFELTGSCDETHNASECIESGDHCGVSTKLESPVNLIKTHNQEEKQSDASDRSQSEHQSPHSATTHISIIHSVPEDRQHRVQSRNSQDRTTCVEIQGVCDDETADTDVISESDLITVSAKTENLKHLASEEQENDGLMTASMLFTVREQTEGESVIVSADKPVKETSAGLTTSSVLLCVGDEYQGSGSEVIDVVNYSHDQVRTSSTIYATPDKIDQEIPRGINKQGNVMTCSVLLEAAEKRENRQKGKGEWFDEETDLMTASGLYSASTFHQHENAGTSHELQTMSDSEESGKNHEEMKVEMQKLSGGEVRGSHCCPEAESREQQQGEVTEQQDGHGQGGCGQGGCGQGGCGQGGGGQGGCDQDVSNYAREDICDSSAGTKVQGNTDIEVLAKNDKENEMDKYTGQTAGQIGGHIFSEETDHCDTQSESKAKDNEDQGIDCGGCHDNQNTGISVKQHLGEFSCDVMDERNDNEFNTMKTTAHVTGGSSTVTMATGVGNESWVDGTDGSRQFDGPMVDTRGDFSSVTRQLLPLTTDILLTQGEVVQQRRRSRKISESSDGADRTSYRSEGYDSSPVILRKRTSSADTVSSEDSDSQSQASDDLRKVVLRSPRSPLHRPRGLRHAALVDGADDQPRQSEDSDDDDDAGIYAESFRMSRWLYLGDGQDVASLNDPRVSLSVDALRSSKASSSGVGSEHSSTSPLESSMNDLDTTGSSLGDRSCDDHDRSCDDPDRSCDDPDRSCDDTDRSCDDPDRSCDSGSEHMLVLRSDSREDILDHVMPKWRFFHSRSESISTTASEIEFQKKYQAKTRRIVHRKSSIQMYQRVSERFYDDEHRVLLITKKEGDVSFGFHIKGNSPIIISTIEPGSASEVAGLRVGDVLIAVNDVNVLEASHQEVIKLMAADTEKVRVTVAADKVVSDLPLCDGYLVKQGGSGILKNWRRRWFVLKQDHCLYYYKTQTDKDPLGAILLHNYTVTKAPEINRKHTFKVTKYGQRTYYFQADNEEQMNRWASAMSTAATSTTKGDTWLDVSSHNVGLPALSIKNPDCHGHLTKMGNRRKNWKRRYCVLKDACLYYYLDVTSSTAQGVAHLHGYQLDESSIFNKKFGFSLLPAEPNMRTFYFYADNETDMKRWLRCLQKSIGRWVRVDDM